jgi:hypothetical protein
MYLEKSRGCGLRIGVALCRPCAPKAPSPPHHLSSPQQSAAEPLEKFCNHWHQGTVVTAVTTFGRRGSESMVGTRTGVLPCLWCGLKGAPLYLGDSGDGGDAVGRFTLDFAARPPSVPLSAGKQIYGHHRHSCHERARCRGEHEPRALTSLTGWQVREVRCL